MFGLTIAGYGYLEVEKSPGKDTQRLHNIRVMIPRNRQTKENTPRLRYSEVARLPGIITQRLNNLRIMMPGNCLIVVYHYPEIAMKKPFLGNNFAKTK